MSQNCKIKRTLYPESIAISKVEWYGITLNKTYEVRSQDKLFIEVKNDFGDYVWWMKKYFKLHIITYETNL